MSTKKSNLESFVNQFVAFVKGDNAEANAEKVYRQRKAALNSAKAKAEGEIVSKELDIEQAEENLSNARLNQGEFIKKPDTYLQNLQNAKESLEDAKEALESQKELLEFIESELML